MKTQKNKTAEISVNAEIKSYEDSKGLWSFIYYKILQVCF
jgi:hypothetical protein